MRTAGVILLGRTFPESTGAAAPFPFVGGPSALPPFLDMLASELAVARAAAVRVPSSEDPGSFTGTSTEAMRRGVLANEYHSDQELELLLALKVKHPSHFAERLTPEQRARVEVYATARDAAGHGGDPLPAANTSTVTVTPGIDLNAASAVVATLQASAGGKTSVLYVAVDAYYDTFTVYLSGSATAAVKVAWHVFG